MERHDALVADAPAGRDPLRLNPGGRAFFMEPASPFHQALTLAMADIVAMLWLMRQMIDRAGSIEGFFLEGYDPDADDIADALDSFSTRAMALDLKAAYGRVPKRPGVCYFFPRPSGGSGCKRLNATSDSRYATAACSSHSRTVTTVFPRYGSADRSAERHCCRSSSRKPSIPIRHR